ncbi:hypothetical protein [Actinoplanes sp. NPDC026619]|uniref:hypothetical protein n=1 Tax=Actinoplanes sp. NPDC026619 TaxID=3155798 RepID=UPI0033C0DF6A
MAVSWRFDGDDLLSGVGAEWDDFALANDGDACVPPPIGQGLIGFVSSADLCVVWHAILGHTRRDPGRPVTLTYRCDAPAERRLMTATVTSDAHAEVEIFSSVTRREPRAEVPLLGSPAARTTDMIRMCGWCSRIRVDGWVDVEEGCRRLGLLELEPGPLPRVTHGICDNCRDTLTSGIDLEPGLLSR